MANDILIKNGTVIDGTGSPAVRADVIVRGDRIEAVGRFPDAAAARVIDAQGLAVAPGFIDVHTHLDFFLSSPRHPEVMERWARQGVTTVVAGNCGFSPAPIRPESQETVKTYWNFAFPRDGLTFAWSTTAEYFDCMERNGLAYNVAVLTGHNVLRINAMGMQARPPGQDEMSRMKAMLKESLEAGSIGLSVGLLYCPGCFSRTEELTDLASMLTEYGAPLATHTRGMSEIYDQAVGEVIHVAEANRIPLHLSHHFGGFATGGLVNPTRIKAKLSFLLGRTLGESFAVKNQLKAMPAHLRANDLIARARDRGVEVGHDMLPWMCAFTTLLTILPPASCSGGTANLLERLRDPEERRGLVREMKAAVPRWPTWEHGWWTDNIFDGSYRLGGFKLEKNRPYENRRIQEIARDRGTDLYNTAFDLIVEEEGRVFFVYSIDDQTLSDWIGAYAISDPDCAIMTDIVGVDYPNPSPVSYGAFAKVLGQFARDEGRMSQEEAIRKMTSLPARQMRLKDRGILKKGAFADLSVFNPRTVKNRASFQDPHRFAEGVEYVLINGRPVLERGAYDPKALAGKVIRRS
jgi:N-acyl-D-amino-acid deacylase